MIESVLLRPMRRSEAGLVARWERDPQNEPFVIPWDEGAHAAAVDDPDLQHFMVEADGEAVGFVLLAGLRNDSRSVEFRRIVITQKGAGYGRAAVEGVKRHCFDELGTHRLWLDVIDTNVRARSLYESAGFRTEGFLRESLKVGGGFASLLVMSMLASEYRTTTTSGPSPEGVTEEAEGGWSGGGSGDRATTEVAEILAAAQLNRRLLVRALSEVPESVALLRPAVDGNHIAFLALHLLDARTYAANLMSGPPVRHELAEMLESATGIDDIAVFPALEQVTREWGEVCDAFERRLKEQDESSLSAESGRTYPNGRSDLLGVLSFLMHHESYHIGQVNLLRRHAGLKPVSFHE